MCCSSHHGRLKLISCFSLSGQFTLPAWWLGVVLLAWCFLQTEWIWNQLRRGEKGVGLALFWCWFVWGLFIFCFLSSVFCCLFFWMLLTIRLHWVIPKDGLQGIPKLSCFGSFLFKLRISGGFPLRSSISPYSVARLLSLICRCGLRCFC